MPKKPYSPPALKTVHRPRPGRSGPPFLLAVMACAGVCSAVTMWSAALTAMVLSIDLSTAELRIFAAPGAAVGALLGAWWATRGHAR